MSKKKSESGLPSGDLYYTEGSNYGLDGYRFDMDYNAGVLQGIEHPQTVGVSSLPEDLVADTGSSNLPSYGDLELDTKMASNVEAVSQMLSEKLIDLSWLEVEGQDLDRLPKNPVDLSIPELAEAWSRNREASEFPRVPGVRDLEEVRYRQSLKETTKKASIPKKLKNRILKEAIRESEAGISFDQIKRKALKKAGEYKDQLERGISLIKKDHGLAGNVFIRASAYPGCQNQGASSKIASNAKKAKYILKASKCEGCVLAQGGNCTVFKKALVNKVPWKKAKEKYASYLKALGKDLDSSLSPRESLRKAFLSEGFKEEVSSDLPVDIKRMETRPLKEAFENLSSLKREVQVLTKESKEKELQKEKLNQKLSSWRDRGLLSENEYGRLSQSSAPYREVLKVAASLITLKSKTGSYGGSGNYYNNTAQTLWKMLRVNEAKTAQDQKAVQDRLISKAANKLRALRNANLLTQKEMEKVASHPGSLKDKLELAQAIISYKSRHKTKKAISLEEVRDYSGEGEKAIASYDGVSISEGMENLRAAKAEKKAFEEKVNKVVKFAKAKMAEGWRGDILNLILRDKFPENLVKAAKQALRGKEYFDLKKYSASVDAPVNKEAYDYQLTNSSLDNFETYKTPGYEPVEGIQFDEGWIID